MLRVCAAAIFLVLPVLAQSSPPDTQSGGSTNSTASAPVIVGLENDWDIAPVLQEIAKHTDKLLPALDHVDARSWINEGASETYMEQVQTAKDLAKSVAGTARALAENPEQLAVSVDFFIRMKDLDVMLLSVEEGIRKYQTAAEAQALAGVEAEGAASRERFIRYIINLASAREQDLKVMDEEAQRCRGIVTAPPTAKTVKKK